MKKKIKKTTTEDRLIKYFVKYFNEKYKNKKMR